MMLLRGGGAIEPMAGSVSECGWEVTVNLFHHPSPRNHKHTFVTISKLIALVPGHTPPLPGL